MTTIVTRSSKGSALSHAEGDANFTNLNTDKIEPDDVRTLTNKTINLASNTVTGTTAEFNTSLSDGNFTTLAGAETLTNKSISLTSNTLTGTTAEFNTALSDGNFATQAGSETLTNKTLTSPTINSGTLSGSFTVAATTISDTELSYLDGVTSNIQTQINNVPQVPITTKVVADTTDITLNDIAASYNNFGSTFVVTIPTSGYLTGFMTGRLRSDSANTGSLYVGLRIGGVNYWLGQFYNNSGGSLSYIVALTSDNVLNSYDETQGFTGSAANGGNRLGLSIAAAGIPTGSQTVQLIVARAGFTCSLLGATTTSRYHIQFVGTN